MTLINFTYGLNKAIFLVYKKYLILAFQYDRIDRGNIDIYKDGLWQIGP